MISVTEALNALFSRLAPLSVEAVSLTEANGRVLAAPITATRAQPPFAASVMDGYAIAAEKVVTGQSFRIVGEAAAGNAFQGSVRDGEAVRIFTGAPVPSGARRVIIQEDVDRTDAEILVRPNATEKFYIRVLGADFNVGDQIDAPVRLTPRHVSLIAAMNVASVPVTRRPTVAIISTGNELVAPGEAPRNDQIIASNALGIAALVEDAGATARVLPIARDNEDSLNATIDLAQDSDLILTIGGASVGDHDIVAPVFERRGMERAFHRVAVRPGKPLMAGSLGTSLVIGLPGNPVSSLICAHVFVVPTIDRLLGLPPAPRGRRQARLTAPLEPNGPREHYMRARLSNGGVAAFPSQDSAILTVLADANALIMRPPNDPARDTGDTVEILDL
ncbi:MAG: gephyrin-like molybdotransferase Glp [Pseudomonadota bacterium]